MNKFILSLLLGSALLSSCSSAKIYSSPDAITKAAKHETIAIAPPEVSIVSSKKIDAEAMKEQQKTESINIQIQMHIWLSIKKKHGRFTVQIQDVETTNAKLKKAGYFDGTAMTPNEICATLGVDAIVTSNYILSKPIYRGAQITADLFGISTFGINNIIAVLEIHDMESKKLLWSYSDKIRDNSSYLIQDNLIDDLMRRASKKMPYSK